MRLVLVTDRDSRPRRLREFQRAARRISRLWGADTDLVPVGSGASVVDAIVAAGRDDRIERLAICCHGWPDRLISRGRGIRLGRHAPPGVVSVAYLLEVLVPRLAPQPHLAIAACSAAADPGWARWLPRGRTYASGGACSLCAALSRGLGPDATVVGHSAPGHTTQSPALRAWGGQYGVDLAGAGASVLDHYLGPDAHRDRRLRARWLRECRWRDDRGLTGAELLLAGLVPDWMRGR